MLCHRSFFFPVKPQDRQHPQEWLEGRFGDLAEAAPRGDRRRGILRAQLLQCPGWNSPLDGSWFEGGWKGRMDSRPARQGWTSARPAPGEGALPPAGIATEREDKVGGKCSRGGAEGEIPAGRRMGNPLPCRSAASLHPRLAGWVSPGGARSLRGIPAARAGGGGWAGKGKRSRLGCTRQRGIRRRWLGTTE